MNSNIFRIIVFFVVLFTLPLLTLSNKEIDFKNLEAENIKIFFSENIEIENFKTYKNGVGCYAGRWCCRAVRPYRHSFEESRKVHSRKASQPHGGVPRRNEQHRL